MTTLERIIDEANDTFVKENNDREQSLVIKRWQGVEYQYQLISMPSKTHYYMGSLEECQTRMKELFESLV